MQILAHEIPGLPWVAAFDWQGLADQARTLMPTLCPHHRTGRSARHHFHQASVQRQFKLAVRKAAIPKPATSHCMRHGLATRLLENHYDLRTSQELLGHTHVNTTQIYLHVLNQPGLSVRSPLDS